MEFSPEPWDLLAWSEDHGRVGVADVRQAFCRRQFLDLNPEIAQQIDLEDVTPLAIRNLDTKGRLIHQYRERMQLEYGRPPTPAEDLILRSAHTAGIDLDARERSVLDTLEMTMDEIYEASHPRPPHPYSLNYTSSPRVRASLESERAASRANEQTDERERMRSIERSYLPRRRNSVILSRHTTLAPPRATSRSRITASPSQLSQADEHEAEDEDTDPELPALMSINDLTPTIDRSSTQPLPYNIPPSDPWHVIQSALESARASENTNPGPASINNLASVEAALNSYRRTATSRPSEPTSAQTSALPTTRPIDSDVRRYMDDALAQARETFHIDRRTNAARNTLGDSARDIERHQRILEARAQARQRVAAANASANSGGRSSRTERRTELGRPSDSDMRLARLMMMSSSRQATDQNGNWVAGEALERLIAARSAGVDADGLGGRGVATHLAREAGLGTTGVSWSPDGRHL